MREKILAQFPIFLLGLILSLGVVSGGAVAGLGIGAGVLLFGAACFEQRRVVIRGGLFVYGILLALLGLTLLLPLSSFPATSAWSLLKLAGVLVPLGFLLHPFVHDFVDRHKGNLFVFLAICLFVGLLVMLFRHVLVYVSDLEQLAKEARWAKMNRGVSYGFLFLWPVLAWLAGQRRWGFFAGLVLVALPLLFLTYSRATQLAIALSVVVLPLALWGRNLFRHAFLGAGLLGFAWPFAAQQAFAAWFAKVEALPPSWRARVEIWDYVSYRIMEKPWTGWGLGASSLLDSRAPHGDLYLFTPHTAAHPHNVFGQLWVELGVFGIGLGVGILFLVWKGLARCPRPLFPYAAMAVVTGFFLTLVAYNFWTDSMLSAFAVTLFLFSLAQEPRGEIWRGEIRADPVKREARSDPS